MLEPADYVRVLLAVAEKRGTREEAYRLLCENGGVGFQLAAFFECGAQLLEIAHSFEPVTHQVLDLCGVRVAWAPIRPDAPFPSFSAQLAEFLETAWYDRAERSGCLPAE